MMARRRAICSAPLIRIEIGVIKGLLNSKWENRVLVARKKAKKVQEKKPRKNMFPSDAESIELRRKSAEAQAAKVTPQKDGEGVFDTYAVGSMQWDSPYMVEIRDLSGKRRCFTDRGGCGLIGMPTKCHFSWSTTSRRARMSTISTGCICQT